MFKLIRKSSFILTFLLGSFAVNANLLSSNYIIVEHDNNHFVDWAWASSVNVQYDGFFELDVNGELIFDENGNPVLQDSTDQYNELYAPEHIEGWRIATDEEFSFFQNNVGIESFINADKTYIVATSFWNSFYTENEDISIDAFPESNGLNGSGYKASSWVDGSFYDVDNYNPTWVYDTFYVRTHSSDPQPVPEPSTLMIFALGLTVLASKKKLFFALTNKALH